MKLSSFHLANKMKVMKSISGVPKLRPTNLPSTAFASRLKPREYATVIPPTDAEPKHDSDTWGSLMSTTYVESWQANGFHSTRLDWSTIDLPGTREKVEVLNALLQQQRHTKLASQLQPIDLRPDTTEAPGEEQIPLHRHAHDQNRRPAQRGQRNPRPDHARDHQPEKPPCRIRRAILSRLLHPSEECDGDVQQEQQQRIERHNLLCHPRSEDQYGDSGVDATASQVRGLARSAMLRADGSAEDLGLGGECSPLTAQKVSEARSKSLMFEAAKPFGRLWEQN